MLTIRSSEDKALKVWHARLIAKADVNSHTPSCKSRHDPLPRIAKAVVSSPTLFCKTQSPEVVVSITGGEVQGHIAPQDFGRLPALFGV